jgi:hypothetical protein
MIDEYGESRQRLPNYLERSQTPFECCQDGRPGFSRQSRRRRGRERGHEHRRVIVNEKEREDSNSRETAEEIDRYYSGEKSSLDERDVLGLPETGSRNSSEV